MNDYTHEDEFLKELTQLTKKYKIEIKGCGCCGSPYLKNIETIKENSKYIYEDQIQLEFMDFDN